MKSIIITKSTKSRRLELFWATQCVFLRFCFCLLFAKFLRIMLKVLELNEDDKCSMVYIVVFVICANSIHSSVRSFVRCNLSNMLSLFSGVYVAYLHNLSHCCVSVTTSTWHYVSNSYCLLSMTYGSNKSKKTNNDIFAQSICGKKYLSHAATFRPFFSRGFSVAPTVFSALTMKEDLRCKPG